MFNTTEQNDDFLILQNETAEKVIEAQPDEDVLFDLAELFKIFGDSNRIRILYALSGVELCVSDLARILSLSSSAVSH
ncbi:MAG: transcriptional regulator, partial [Clostridia bacterium]|nr:transcriptional regulator [Clostridia bacterium]